jgi:hypothetical protein
VLKPVSVLLSLLGVPAPVTAAITVASSAPRFTSPADPPPPLTGPLMESGTFRGRVGRLMVRGIRVRVYADRIVVRAPFSRVRTIMATYLVELYYDPGNILRIEHRARGLVSPVCLKVRLPHPMHDAILEVFDNGPNLD